MLEDITPLDEEDPTLMHAHISNVKVVGMPYSQLGDEEEEGRVLGMELLLAALEACGVDNARIEVEGGHEVSSGWGRNKGHGKVSRWFKELVEWFCTGVHSWTTWGLEGGWRSCFEYGCLWGGA